MIHQIGQWCERHIQIPGLPVWASFVVIAIVMGAMSLAITAAVLVSIPANYFCSDAAHRSPRYRHPIVRWSLRILRNILGWFLIGLGIILLFPGVPGQGLLTVLLGVMLAEFPGKRSLELRIIRMPRVFNAVNALRTRFGKAPLEPPAMQ